MAGGDKNLWIIANFKSHKSISESVEWISIVGPSLEKREDIKVIVCPSFSAIEQVKKAVQVGNYPLMVGSQDLSAFGPGAYTGEEPAKFLADFISLSILGHSERRTNFNESDEMVAKKVIQAKENNILALVCVQDRETSVPDGCKMVAYEPVWAIGSGKAETPQGANEVAKVLKEKHGEDLIILYGGSVDEGNVKGFIDQDNLSGVLVATACLDPEEFLRVYNSCLS